MSQPASDDDIRQSIHNHIFNNDCEEAQEILMRYPHLINKATKDGRTPLHDAVIEYIFNFEDLNPQKIKSCRKFINFLLQQKDININIKESHGFTPVMFFFHPEEFPEHIQKFDFVGMDEKNGRIIELFLNREDLKLQFKKKLLTSNLNFAFDLDLYLMRKLIHHKSFTLKFFKKICKEALDYAQHLQFLGLLKILEVKPDWKTDSELIIYASIFSAYRALQNNEVHESTLHAVSYTGPQEQYAQNVTILNQKFLREPVQITLAQQLKTMQNYCKKHELLALTVHLDRAMKKIS
jgi:hypothetical protein